jgi:CRP/FNR family transcriptional regulator
LTLQEPNSSKKTFQADDCSDCSVKVFCLPVGMSSQIIHQLNALVKHKHVLHRGDPLFQAGQLTNVLYVVRSGSFKTYRYTNSQEQIINFHFPGEVLGFEPLCIESHDLFAKALETSSVCEIDYDDLLHLSSKQPSLQKRLLSLACSRQERHALFTLTSSAIERVSAFLLNLSARFHKQGLSAKKFYLSMPRQDIANYLGLTNETTSRMFSQIVKEKAIAIDNRQIEIIDIKKFKRYSI